MKNQTMKADRNKLATHTKLNEDEEFKQWGKED